MSVTLSAKLMTALGTLALSNENYEIAALLWGYVDPDEPTDVKVQNLAFYSIRFKGKTFYLLPTR